VSDIAEYLLRPFATALLWVLRALLWLGWELMFSTIGWSVGWCVIRVISLGRLPSVSIRDEEHYDLLPRILVELVGLGSLFAACWWLATLLQT
jgi:hypothetical protein